MIDWMNELNKLALRPFSSSEWESSELQLKFKTETADNVTR